MRSMLLICWVAAVGAAYGQNGRITGSANRAQVARPDSMDFSITISMGPRSTEEQAAQLLAPVGVGVHDLRTFRSEPERGLRLWTFETNVEVARSAIMEAALEGIRARLPAGTVLRYEGRTTVSADADEASRARELPELIRRARAHAESIAAAAGIHLGPLRTIRDGDSPAMTFGAPGDEDGIVVRINRSIRLAPDEALFEACIAAADGTTVEELAASLLPGIGFTPMVLAGQKLGSQFPDRFVERCYRLVTPIGAWSGTLELLEAARAKTAPRHTLRYSMALRSSATAIDAASRGWGAWLVESARQRAAALGGAAGVRPGNLLSISRTDAPSLDYLAAGDGGVTVYFSLTTFPAEVRFAIGGSAN